jgi:hypothetical protein
MSLRIELRNSCDDHRAMRIHFHQHGSNSKNGLLPAVNRDRAYAYVQLLQPPRVNTV